MCDLSQLTPGIVIASAGIIAAIVSIGVAIVLNNGFFTAPGSPAAMIAAAISCGVAITGLFLAKNNINEYYECMGAPEACAGELANVLNTIAGLITILSIQAVACLAAAGIAWIPWAGAAPMYVILGALLSQVALIPWLYAALVSLIFCLAEEKDKATTGPVLTGAIVAAVATIVVTGIVRRRLKMTSK